MSLVLVSPAKKLPLLVLVFLFLFLETVVWLVFILPWHLRLKKNLQEYSRKRRNECVSVISHSVDQHALTAVWPEKKRIQVI